MQRKATEVLSFTVWREYTIRITGHGLTDLVIDATEFKFQSASNFELNSLMFSNYKNTQTGKVLVGISPHGGGILFSDIFPGSTSDSNITEDCGAAYLV